MQLEPVRLFMSASPVSASTPNLLLGPNGQGLVLGPHGQGLATTSPTELGIDPNEMAMVASGLEWSLFGTIPGGTLSWIPGTARKSQSPARHDEGPAPSARGLPR